MKFEAEESTLLYFCGCKASQNKPFCDGSHKKL
jgi:CDGSH-type Zn-finger protein